MLIDDTNALANYARYLACDINKAVRELSNEQKQALLDNIQLHKATHTLMGQEYNHQNCEYIESLLNGTRPKQPLAPRTKDKEILI